MPADQLNDKRLEIRRRLWDERNRRGGASGARPGSSLSSRGVDGGRDLMTAGGATYRGDAISMLSRFLVDCGPFLGEWRCKCLQAALLYLFRSATFLEDLERSLLAACGNHSPSGALADTTAMSNDVAHA